MDYAEIKAVYEFCSSLRSEPDTREVLQCITDGHADFEVSGVRFIREDSILEVMQEEIFSDLYLLGCFNAYFIAENSDLNYELVQACQNAEAYGAIGEAMNNTMTDREQLEFCAEYASADGYGHHFNSYDGNCEEITINNQLWLVFDCH